MKHSFGESHHLSHILLGQVEVRYVWKKATPFWDVFCATQTKVDHIINRLIRDMYLRESIDKLHMDSIQYRTRIGSKESIPQNIDTLDSVFT